MARYRVDVCWAGFGHATTGNFEYDGDSSGLAAFAERMATEMLPWELCPDTSFGPNLDGSVRDESGMWVASVTVSPPAA